MERMGLGYKCGVKNEDPASGSTAASSSPDEGIIGALTALSFLKHRVTEITEHECKLRRAEVS